MHHIHRNNFLWHVRERDNEDDRVAEQILAARESAKQHMTEQVRIGARLIS